jgi:hypothetical protein
MITGHEGQIYARYALSEHEVQLADDVLEDGDQLGNRTNAWNGEGGRGRQDSQRECL